MRCATGVHGALFLEFGGFVVKTAALARTHVDNQVWTSCERCPIDLIFGEETVARLIGRVEHCLLAPELFQAGLGEGRRVARRFQQAIPKVNLECTLRSSLGCLERLVIAMM